MSEFDKELLIDNDDELEQLLSHASPRTVPDEVANAAVRRAVHTEWRKVTGQHKRRRHVTRFAIAASILIAVFSVFSVFRPTSIDVVQVASIQKSFGSIYFLGAQSVLTPAHSLTTIQQGQTIVTGKDAGIALAWNSGGSLRLGKETQVEFRDDDSIYLHSGKVYFDSKPSELIDGAIAAVDSTFVVKTDRGTVTHIGTQFMTEAMSDALTVSVREGRVAIDGNFQQQVVALRGEQIVIDGHRQPHRRSVSGHGDRWAWIAETSPAVNVDGQYIDTFLNWAARELGYEIKFIDDVAKNHAEEEKLEGEVHTGPVEALHMRMQTTRLDYKIDEARGVIDVRFRD